MDLHYLRIFYEVAKEKSFTKAANNLFINQSAVSIQIKKFEDNLSTKLFDRSGKKIKMTYAGEVLFKMAEDIFQKVKRAEKEMEKVVLFQRGKLNIGATHMVGEPLLPKILKEYGAKKDGIEFEVHISERDILLKELKEGKLDVLLMGDYFIKDRNFKIMPIDDYPFVLVSKEDITDFSKLEEMPLVNRDDSILLEKNVDYLESKYGINLSDRITVNGSIETVKNLVMEGVGYTILPFYCVSKELERGGLNLVAGFDDYKNGYQAVITEEKEEGDQVFDFIEFIKNFKVEGYELITKKA